MPVWSYSFRWNILTTEKAYRLEAQHLEWSNGRRKGVIAYHDVTKMVVFKKRFIGSAVSYWCNVLHLRSGERIKLGAAHRVRFRKVEDRTAIYIPFIKELEARVQRRNPDTPKIEERYWLSRVENIAGRFAVLILRGSRWLNLRRSSAFIGWVTCLIGPNLRGHRIALANLVAAYPEKSATELDGTLSEMWDNLGRTVAEYTHLDRMWDYDQANSKSGRIMVDEASAERLRRLSLDRKPILIFSAHLANWELSGPAMPAIGREGAVLYKPPSSPALAEELARIRRRCWGTIIPANTSTVFRLKNAIQRGACIVILVDQHYANGVDVTFFGRTCKVNPMIARLTRSFECQIYGSRMIRLPDGRFRYDLTGPLNPPRDHSGKIAIVPTMQIITDVVESWIREYPGQWMWLHHRWR